MADVSSDQMIMIGLGVSILIVLVVVVLDIIGMFTDYVEKSATSVGQFLQSDGTVSSAIPEFKAGTEYEEGVSVRNNNILYTANVTHTADTFDETKWDKISTAVVGDSERGTFVSVETETSAQNKDRLVMYLDGNEVAAGEEDENGEIKWTFKGIMDPKAFRFDSMTEAQRDDFVGVKGDLIYNEDAEAIQTYTADGEWVNSVITFSSAGFSNNLETSDDTVQKIFDKVDALPVGLAEKGTVTGAGNLYDGPGRYDFQPTASFGFTLPAATGTGGFHIFTKSDATANIVTFISTSVISGVTSLSTQNQTIVGIDLIPGTWLLLTIGAAASSTATNVAPLDHAAVAAVGTSLEYARADHQHAKEVIDASGYTSGNLDITVTDLTKLADAVDVLSTGLVKRGVISAGSTSISASFDTGEWIINTGGGATNITLPTVADSEQFRFKFVIQDASGAIAFAPQVGASLNGTLNGTYSVPTSDDGSIIEIRSYKQDNWTVTRLGGDIVSGAFVGNLAVSLPESTQALADAVDALSFPQESTVTPANHTGTSGQIGVSSEFAKADHVHAVAGFDFATSVLAADTTLTTSAVHVVDPTASMTITLPGATPAPLAQRYIIVCSGAVNSGNTVTVERTSPDVLNGDITTGTSVVMDNAHDIFMFTAVDTNNWVVTRLGNRTSTTIVADPTAANTLQNGTHVVDPVGGTFSITMPNGTGSESYIFVAADATTALVPVTFVVTGANTISGDTSAANVVTLSSPGQTVLITSIEAGKWNARMLGQQLDASAFSGNLAVTDTSLQNVADKLDALALATPTAVVPSPNGAVASAGTSGTEYALPDHVHFNSGYTITEPVVTANGATLVSGTYVFTSSGGFTNFDLPPAAAQHYIFIGDSSISSNTLTFTAVGGDTFVGDYTTSTTAVMTRPGHTFSIDALTDGNTWQVSDLGKTINQPFTNNLIAFNNTDAKLSDIADVVDALPTGNPKRLVINNVSFADAGEGIYTVDGSGGSFTFTLPAAGTTQRQYTFTCENLAVSTNVFTVAVTGANELNSVASGTFEIIANVSYIAHEVSASGWVISRIGVDPSTTIKLPVRVATTDTLFNTAAATGLTVGFAAGTFTFNGTPTVDGVNAFSGYRVLVKDQVDQEENGVYEMISTNVWTRSSTFDEPSDFNLGTQIDVVDGDLNKGNIYRVTSVPATMNTDPLVFTLQTQGQVSFHHTVAPTTVATDTVQMWSETGGDIYVMNSGGVPSRLTNQGGGSKIPVDAVATGDVQAENLANHGAIVLWSAGVFTNINSSYTVDGVTPSGGVRILVNSQTDPVQNGIYEVDSGDDSIWRRSADFNSSESIKIGMTVRSSTEGLTQGNKLYRVVDAPTTIDAATNDINLDVVEDEGLYVRDPVNLVTVDLQTELTAQTLSIVSFTLGTLTLSSVPNIDGQTVGVSDRILVINPANPQYGGVYIVTSAANVWNRAEDVSVSSEISLGMELYVLEGDIYSTTTFKCVDVPDVMNDDPFVFELLQSSTISLKVNTTVPDEAPSGTVHLFSNSANQLSIIGEDGVERELTNQDRGYKMVVDFATNEDMTTTWSDPIDGVPVGDIPDGSRLLLYGQSNPGLNGVYIATSAFGGTAVVLDGRADDFNDPSQFQVGTRFHVVGNHDSALHRNVTFQIKESPSTLITDDFVFEMINHSPAYGHGPVMVVATSNVDLSSTPGTIDGVDVNAQSAGTRVLLTSQTDPLQNGIYVTEDTSIAADKKYVRARDFLRPDQVKIGSRINVRGSGTVYPSAEFEVTAFGIIGTDAPTFAQVENSSFTVDYTKDHVAAVATSNVDITNAPATIDGVDTFTPTNQRFLLTGQTDPSENGVYVGGTATIARSADFSTSAQFGTGTHVFVDGGIKFRNTRWYVSEMPASLGSGPLTFSQVGEHVMPTYGVESVSAASSSNVDLSLASTAIDGVSTTVQGTRVLLFGQTSSSENGVYVSADVSVGDLKGYVRANDFDTTLKFGKGTRVSVSGGDTLSGAVFEVSTVPSTLDTDPLEFTNVTRGLFDHGQKDPVRLKANTADIGEFDMWADGVFTSTVGPGVINIDGITIAVGDRVLVAENTDKERNGIYIVTSIGAGTTMIRASDFDSFSKFKVQTKVRVHEGGSNANTEYYVSAAGTDINTAVTGEIEFVQIFAGGLTTVRLDASGGAVALTLDPAIGSGQEILYILVNKDNNVTAQATSGEYLNSTEDGVFVFSNYPEGTKFLLTDRSLGNWDLSVVGITQSSSYQTSVETLVYTSGTPVLGVSYTHSGTEITDETGQPDGVRIGEIYVTRSYIGDGMAKVSIQSSVEYWKLDPGLTVTLPTGTLSEYWSGSINRQEINISAMMTILPNGTDSFVIDRDTSIDDNKLFDFHISGLGQWFGEEPAAVQAGMVVPKTLDRFMRYGSADTASTLWDTVDIPLDATVLDAVGIAPSTSNIADNADGTVTLKAGNSYKLEASVLWNASSTPNTNDTYYRWYDDTTSTYVGAPGASMSHSDSGGAFSSAVHFTGVLGTDTTFSVRNHVADATGTEFVQGSKIIVEMLPTQTVVNPDTLTPETLHRVKLINSSNISGISVNEDITILFDTSVYDVGGLGNTSTGEVTIQQSGLYEIEATWIATQNASNKQTILQVDGVTVKRSVASGTDSGVTHVPVSTKLFLNAGQIVTAQAYVNVANNISSGADSAFLQVTQLPTQSVVAYNPGEIEAIPLSYFHTRNVTGTLSSSGGITGGSVVTDVMQGTGIQNNGDGSFTMMKDGLFSFSLILAMNGSNTGIDFWWTSGIDGTIVSNRGYSAHTAHSAYHTSPGIAHFVKYVYSGEVYAIDSGTSQSFSQPNITIQELPSTEVIRATEIPVSNAGVDLGTYLVGTGADTGLLPIVWNQVKSLYESVDIHVVAISSGTSESMHFKTNISTNDIDADLFLFSTVNAAQQDIQMRVSSDLSNGGFTTENVGQSMTIKVYGKLQEKVVSVISGADVTVTDWISFTPVAYSVTGDSISSAVAPLTGGTVEAYYQVTGKSLTIHYFIATGATNTHTTGDHYTFTLPVGFTPTSWIQSNFESSGSAMKVVGTCHASDIRSGGSSQGFGPAFLVAEGVCVMADDDGTQKGFVDTAFYELSVTGKDLTIKVEIPIV